MAKEWVVDPALGMVLSIVLTAIAGTSTYKSNQRLKPL